MNSLSIAGAAGWFGTLVNLSLQAALLAGVVWLAMQAFGRWIPPRWRALIWFLVIVRAMIPFSPPSALSWQNAIPRESKQVVEIAADVPRPIESVAVTEAAQDTRADLPSAQLESAFDTKSPSATPLSRAETKPINYARVFTLVWGGVASFFLAVLLVRAVIIRHRLVRHGLPPAPFVVDLLKRCCEQLRLRYPIRVTASDRIVAPALTGLLPARLIVPTTFGTPRFSAEQVRQILLHELAHVQQGHLFLHWVALIARAVHWFNPAIHFAATRLREECELAADAAALRNSTRDERTAYGETLLRVIADSNLPPTLLAIGMAEQARHLQRRLRALTMNRLGFNAAGIVAVALVAIIGLTSAAQPKAEKPAPKEQRSVNDAKSSPADDSMAISPARKRLLERLNTIRIDDFPIPSDVDLIDVLKELGSEVRKREPGGRGVNLIISQGEDRSSTAPPIDVEKFRIRFDPAIRDVTLAQFFDAMMRVAKPPEGAANSTRLKYTVEDYGIVFSQVVPDDAPRKDKAVADEKSPSRQKMMKKLESIRIDDFPLPSAVDLLEVLKELNSEARKRDPEHRGVNLIIDHAQARAIDPAIDLEKFQIKIDPPVRDLSFRDFCEVLVKVATPPDGAPRKARLRFSIENYAIIFSVDAGGKTDKRSSVDADAPHDVAWFLGNKQMAKLSDPNSASVPILVQDARILIELGKLDDAEKRLRRALQKDPEHRAALYYLSLITEQRYARKNRIVRPETIGLTNAADPLEGIEKTWNEPKGRELLPTPNPFARTNVVLTSPSRQKLYRKLETLRIDDFPSHETTLRELLKTLAEKIRKRDPDGRSINFILSEPNPPTDVDIGNFNIKFDPPIRDVTLGQFLDAIVMLAQPPQPPPASVGLRYSIEDYAIVFSLRTTPAEQFYSRTFRVNPNTFAQGLDRVLFAVNPFHGLTETSGGAFVTTVTNSSALQKNVRDFFAAAGVEFPTNNTAVGGAVPSGFGTGTPQKAMFFNDKRGLLYVRSSLRDLDIVEKALHAVNTGPVLRIDVRVFETLSAGIPASVRAALPKNSAPLLAPTMGITNIGYFTPDQATQFALAAARNSSRIVDLTNFSVHTLPGRQVQIPVSSHDGSSGRRDPSLDVIVNGAGVNSSFDVSCLVTKWEPMSDRTNTFHVRQTPLPETNLHPGETLILAAPAMHSKKVPVLGDIPYIDRLFTKEGDERDEHVWIILLTPVIETRKN